MSTVSISLEKRFKMRPTGVTSKNVVQGTRKIFDRSNWWSNWAPFNAPINNVNADNSTERAEKPYNMFQIKIIFL